MPNPERYRRGPGGGKTRPRPAAALATIVVLVTGCSGDSGDADSWTVVRDTLESGAVLVTNTPPPSGDHPGYVVAEELRIGSVAGDGPDQFGQVRGIAALDDGRIAVLDAQARELRIFDPAGAHLATFGGQGAGPGELAGPWGLMRDDEDRLWVPDYSNSRMNVFDPESGFVRSHSMPHLLYGFMWEGAMLDDGRIVKPSITLAPERREMLRVYDQQMTLVDSILMPKPAGPPVDPKNPPSAFYWEAGGIRGYMNVPFYPSARTVYTPGGDIWSSPAGEPVYRLVRTDLRGDTALVVETEREPVPLPQTTRDSAIEGVREALRERGGDTRQDWSRVPQVKAPIEQLFVSDEGQLWVRTASSDPGTRFDVYDPDGAFDRSVTTSIPFWPYARPIVRGDRFWGIVADELGVHHVVQGRIRDAAAEPEGT